MGVIDEEVLDAELDLIEVLLSVFLLLHDFDKSHIYIGRRLHLRVNEQFTFIFLMKFTALAISLWSYTRVSDAWDKKVVDEVRGRVENFILPRICSDLARICLSQKLTLGEA